MMEWWWPFTRSKLTLPTLRSGFLTFLLLLICNGTFGGRFEKKLLRDLMVDYDNLERPVVNESHPLLVTFGITLQQIIDVDEKNQLLVSCLWLNLEWNDYNCIWNKTEYGDVDGIRIHPRKLWTPDLLMYNSADEKFDGSYQTNVVVSSNGDCLYIPPGIFKSTCKIDITWFPFDDQKCDLKFGSWTYNGWKLDLALKDENGGDISSFISNGEWDLIAVPGKRNIVKYECCPEPYIDITFQVHIRRRTLYYFFNLIVPCVLISSMALLGFTLPPDSGEKLTLDVTILLSLTVFLNTVSESMPNTSDAVPLINVTVLLSLTVFMNLVSEIMPTTSDAVPLIGVTILLSLTVFHNIVTEKLPRVSTAMPLLGTYFNCIMMMVASSVVLTVVVLNYHHRTAETHDMPTWVRKLFLQWLPWMLRMQRPRKPITRKTIMMSTRMRELEMKEGKPSSKSLLANVLDMDDDFRPMSVGAVYGTSGFIRVNGNPMDHTGNGGEHVKPQLPPSSPYITPGVGATVSGGNNVHYVPNSLPPNATLVGGHNCIPTTPTSSVNSTTRELQCILKELKFITNRMKLQEEEAEIIGDWKFAAMVIDRFCLIVFTAFTIITTLAVLCSAPHIFVD